MLAYSATRRPPVGRSSSPNSMLAIVALHVAALAVLMSAKMDLPISPPKTPIEVEFIKPDPVPPEQPVDTPRQPTPRPDSTFTVPDTFVPLPSDPIPLPLPNPLPPIGDADPGPFTNPNNDVPKPIAATPAVLLTGQAELKPPYPASKLASGEEADLKLRLTIDERGRVTAVAPVGRADSSFLAAARRHIIAHWRYRPATNDGRGVATTLVVTLRFRLDD